jgi:hypothetical protein
MPPTYATYVYNTYSLSIIGTYATETYVVDQTLTKLNETDQLKKDPFATKISKKLLLIIECLLFILL